MFGFQWFDAAPWLVMTAWWQRTDFKSVTLSSVRRDAALKPGVNAAIALIVTQRSSMLSPVGVQNCRLEFQVTRWATSFATRRCIAHRVPVLDDF